MELTLPLIGLAVAVFGGLGLALHLVDDDAGVVETCVLALIVGLALVTALLFVGGKVVVADRLRQGVALGCLVIGAVGCATRPRRVAALVAGLTQGRVLAALVALLGLQFAAVLSHTWGTTMGWDGMAVWAMKTRYLCLFGGNMPAGYYTDPTRQWTHPSYPLFLPYLEYWQFTWLGRCDETFAKAALLPFYPAAAGVLWWTARWLTGSEGRGWLAACALFCLPFTWWWPDGSASTGYADFPLAVYFLAATAYLIRFAERGSVRAALTAGLLAAVMPWIKGEGSVLWACLLPLLLIGAWRQRRLAPAALFLLPGLVVILGWRIWINLLNAPPYQAFAPFTVPNVLAGLPLVPTILQEVARELIKVQNWSLLWPVALVVALLGLSAPATRPRVAYLVGVVASIGLYSAVFVLSLWEPVTNHILSSLNRLLLAPALVALLMTVVLGEWRVAGRATGVDLPELNRRHASRERAGDGEREPHVPAAEPPAPTPAPAPTPTPTPRLTPAGRVSSPRRARASEGGSITA